MTRIHALALLSVLSACNGTITGPRLVRVDAGVASMDAGPDAPAVEDFAATDSDFECLLRWELVGHYRIANRLGHQAEAVAVANDPKGGVFPVGTILQIIPDEAMVKRRAGFSPATRDWEFFSLSNSSAGTSIYARGTTSIANFFGGRCVNCHGLAAPQFDLVCGETHGCDPLPFTGAQLEARQGNDPRCP